MLSDHERETLREIQRQLVVDAPELERSFRALGGEVPTAAKRLRWVYTVVIAIAALLGVVLLLAGSVGGGLAFGIVAVSVWLARHFQRTGAR